MKPTKEEMKARAWGIAEGMFYSDDDCEYAWQPFEDWDDAELRELVSDVANSIFNAMVWAQGESDE
jgi:hypothetical protein